MPGPSPLPTGRALELCAELLDGVTRDLGTWTTRQDVNWPAAGQAALVGVDLIIGYLERIRADLVPALVLDDARRRAEVVDLPDPGVPTHATWVPGNSNPGFGGR